MTKYKKRELRVKITIITNYSKGSSHMYMIPYFLKSEAKKLLKIKLSKIIQNISDDFIDNIFYCNSNNKYQEIMSEMISQDEYQKIMLNLEENIKQSVLQALIETFEIFDNLYLNSNDRKKIFNVCIRKCHRNIVTIFGILEFDRIYYYDKKDRNKHFFFIDNLFNLPSYDRYDDIIKAIAIDNAISTNQKKGAEITTKQINSILSDLNNSQQFVISRQDIYNWIDKWNVPSIEYEAIETDSDTLYIMIDEKYIHEQLKPFINKFSNNDVEEKSVEQIRNEFLNFLDYLKNPNKQLLLPPPKKKSKNFIMSKAFISFTDIETKGNRRTLMNKFTFLTTGNNPWDEFMNTISKIFDFQKIKKIKVLSDAGTWITAGISNLKLFVDNIVIPCLCIFHVKQKINRSTKDEILRKSLWNAIENNDKITFNSLFNSILKNKDEKRTKTLKQYRHYILAHWDPINQMKASKYKSSMEAHISHNVAKPFSFEPKAFSKRHIQKLIKLQEYKANGINILNLYLNSSHNTEMVTIKKEELSFSIFDNNSSNLPAINSTNISLSHLLRNISC